MKLICSKSNLVQGVSIVSKAVPSKTTMSILECVLIDASAGIIKLTANDMELGIETIIEEIIEKGIIALEAKLFSDIEENFLIMISLLKLKKIIRLLSAVKKLSLIFQVNQVKILLTYHLLKKMIT